MSATLNRWFPVIIAVLLTFFIVAAFDAPVQVSAARQPDLAPNTCLTCHEDLYYLHDTGSSYCLTDHADRCANCHEGNHAAAKKEEAHIGLVAHPQRDNGAKCEECHTPQDAQARLLKFEAADSFDVVINPDAYIPSAEADTAFPSVSAAEDEFKNWLWLVGAFVLFGAWLVLALFSPSKP